MGFHSILFDGGLELNPEPEARRTRALVLTQHRSAREAQRLQTVLQMVLCLYVCIPGL